MLLFLSKNNNLLRFLLNRAGFLALLSLLLLDSCATLSRYQGVGRIRRYEICDRRLPHEFDSFTIAFLSDTHYPSKFTRKRLGNALRALCDLSPDALFLGGDYLHSDVYADELFTALGSITTPYGKYAVLGNHDIKYAEKLQHDMSLNGIKLLVDEADTLRTGSAQIYICGVQNYEESSDVTWLQQYADSAFTMLIVHTPDYVQDAKVENLSLALSGHTHGGQVTFFGLYAPVTNSRYGKRFLSGLNFTDKGVPVITSNGLGTSRRKIRFCAPSDIIFVTLLCK